MLFEILKIHLFYKKYMGLRTEKLTTIFQDLTFQNSSGNYKDCHLWSLVHFVNVIKDLRNLSFN